MARHDSEQVAEEPLLDEEERKHFPNDFVRGNYKKYLLPVALYLIIALVIFWPLTLNITTTVPSGRPGVSQAGGADVYQFLWNLWWVNYAIFTLHTSPYFTNMLFYPVGANLASDTLVPIAALISLPFQSVSLALAYNAILFMDFALSGFFMFLLADYLIKNKYAAFVAGIAFSFCAFHTIRALYGWLNWDGIEFLPLLILFFLLMTSSPA